MGNNWYYVLVGINLICSEHETLTLTILMRSVWLALGLACMLTFFELNHVPNQLQNKSNGILSKSKWNFE